jgi:hypothetical protein
VPTPEPEGGETPPPPTLEVTEAIRANCVLAGAKVPEPVHIVAFLANARSKGVRSRDWPAALVLWMTRQKTYDARGSPAKTAPRQATPANARWLPKDVP